MTRHRLSQITLTMLCIGALGACSKADRNADTVAARSDSAAGRLDSTGGMASGNTTNTEPAKNAKWSNEQIFGYTHNVDNGEIALGKLASTKGTHAQVKAFGRMMAADHQAMMGQHHKLMGKLNAGMDTTAGDAGDLMNKGQEMVKDLTEKAKGADWDKSFIDGQIGTHEKVLEKLQDVAKNSTDSSLTAALPKSAAKIQEHLTKLQSIKAALDK